MKTRNNNGISVRLLVMILALTLIIGGIVGGSVAWLTARTSTLTNTFTVGDVSISLNESTTDYKMVPGNVKAKNPSVTVTSNSENCYLFIKVEEGNNLGNFIAYAIDSQWTPLTSGSDVYYIIINEANEKGVALNILGAGSLTENGTTYTWEDDQVLVKPTVTKEMLSSLTTATYPTLSFTAYAAQLSNGTRNFTPAEAWDLVKDLTAPVTTPTT